MRDRVRVKVRVGVRFRQHIDHLGSEAVCIRSLSGWGQGCVGPAGRGSGPDPVYRFNTSFKAKGIEMCSQSDNGFLTAVSGALSALHKADSISTETESHSPAHCTAAGWGE